MRRLTFWLSLILIFMIPWEDSISITTLGSLAKVTGVVVAAFWLVILLIEGRFRKHHPFHAFVLVFFLLNAVSLYWSLSADGTLQRVKTYAQIFLLMLVLWELYKKPSDLMVGLQMYILGTYVLIASTILNYMRGTVAVAYEGRYSATGVNAVDLTLILMMGLPVAMYLFFTAEDGILGISQKILNLLYIPLSIFTIILTGSRTSLIAIIPFGILLVVTRQITFSRKLFLFAAFLTASVFLLPLVPQSVINRLSTLESSISEADLGGRVNLWREGVVALSEHPFIGIGGGAVDHALGSAVHNTFLSVAVETGFVGFALFLSILGVAIYEAARLPARRSEIWLTMIFIWAIGVLSLSWEFRKITWIMLNFVIIAGSFENHAPEQKWNTELPAPSA